MKNVKEMNLKMKEISQLIKQKLISTKQLNLEVHKKVQHCNILWNDLGDALENIQKRLEIKNINDII